MKKFFPNIETAVIFVLLVVIGLWSLSRCKKKKEQAALRTATEATINPLDTFSSPAAVRIRKQNPVVATTPNEPVPPQYQPVPMPLPPVPTNTPSTPAYTPSTVATQPANIPQSYNMPIPSPKALTRTTPKVTPKSVPQPHTAPPPSNTMLFVLINGLNIRATADLKAKVKGKLNINEQVYFMNEVTDQAQNVRLANGVIVTKPWFKIQTKKGVVGWVHGSGVDFYKRKPTEGF